MSATNETMARRRLWQQSRWEVSLVQVDPADLREVLAELDDLAERVARAQTLAESWDIGNTPPQAGWSALAATLRAALATTPTHDGAAAQEEEA